MPPITGDLSDRATLLAARDAADRASARADLAYEAAFVRQQEIAAAVAAGTTPHAALRAATEATNAAWDALTAAHAVSNRLWDTYLRAHPVWRDQ